MLEKKKAFGHGEIIYRNPCDYPDSLTSNGRCWYRTCYEYTMVDTGMANYLYSTCDTDEDIRLFVDAAGHIWDESELGIL